MENLMTINEVCSADGKYRYRLEVKISEKFGICLFLMLNPGTEEGHEDRYHPTREKCKGFAQEWGYGTLVDCNLFAVRGKDAKEALSVADPIGLENNRHIKAAASRADKIVLAWGDSGVGALGKHEFNERVAKVVQLLKEASASEKLYMLCPSGKPCLTQKGQPRHPLYLRLNTPLVPFTDEELRRLQGL